MELLLALGITSGMLASAVAIAAGAVVGLIAHSIYEEA